jgi:anaphase-promoting complex subunit 10
MSDEDEEEEAEAEEFEDEEEDDDDSTHAEEPEPEEGTRSRRPSSSRSKPRDYRHLRLKSTPELALLSSPSYREIGTSAHWSLSSSKPGNGVDQLRDSSLETYWQSDGLQPHFINIQFPRRQTVAAIALYMDFNLDESYTPRRMKIRTGTTFHNLEEVRFVEVKNPCGWCVIPLWRKWGEDVLDSILDPDNESDDEEDNDEGGRKKHHVPIHKRKPLRTHFVQIGVVSMHQNGRDTHIRQVKVFGPRDDGSGGGIAGIGSSCRGLVVSRSKSGKSRVGAGEGGASSAAAAEMMIGNGRLSMPTFQSVGMSQFSSIR